MTTKQEEIKRKTKKWIDNRFGAKHHFNLQLMWDYLKFLDGLGVVIKLDRNNEHGKIRELFEGIGCGYAQSDHYKEVLIKAGYVAVGPIIEASKGSKDILPIPRQKHQDSK